MVAGGAAGGGGGQGGGGEAMPGWAAALWSERLSVEEDLGGHDDGGRLSVDKVGVGRRATAQEEEGSPGVREEGGDRGSHRGSCVIISGPRHVIP